DLTLGKSHSGSFRQGNTADTYTLTVNNFGGGSTAGPVTVVDTLPTGLTPAPATNGILNGWALSVSGQVVTATRADALAAGASYPPLTLIVRVADNAPANLTNIATVSGGGELNVANNTAADATPILPVRRRRGA